MQIREQIQDLKACLVGFEIFPSLRDEPTGILSLEAKSVFHFRDSLVALFRDWFSMKVTTNAKLDQSSTIVHVILESTLNDLIMGDSQGTELPVSDYEKPILLVLCTRTRDPHPTSVYRNFDVNYVQQP